MGKHVYFDTGVVLDTIDEEQFLRIVQHHGADKILFGTDAPWAGQKAYVERMNQLPLTHLERNIILEGNSKRLLRM